MRLTIIPSDNAVYVDGISKLPLDLSSCNIPSGIHALQWYENRGWIEFSDDGDPFTPLQPNEDIYSLPDWASACVEAYNNYVEPAPEPAPENIGIPQPVSSGTEAF